LIVAAGIEGEVANQLAGALVKDTDVQIGHEELDRPALVGSAQADVVQPAVVAKGDGAAGIDPVLADSEGGPRLRAIQAAEP
jgi:hypothetical protein